MSKALCNLHFQKHLIIKGDMDFLRFRIFALLSKQLHYTSCIISSANPDKVPIYFLCGCQILIILGVQGFLRMANHLSMSKFMKNINVIENLGFHGNRYTTTIFNKIIISTNSDKILSYFLCGLSDLDNTWCTGVFEDGQSSQHVKIYEKH